MQLLFAVAILSGRNRIGKDIDNKAVILQTFRCSIIDDNGFRDNNEKEKGGVEPDQSELAVETDSDNVSETRPEAGGTAVNWDVDRLQNTEW